MAGRVAGIDVHKKVLMVVVIDADAPAAKPERRRFTTMPSELCRLSTWLMEHGVEEGALATSNRKPPLRISYFFGRLTVLDSLGETVGSCRLDTVY